MSGRAGSSGGSRPWTCMRGCVGPSRVSARSPPGEEPDARLPKIRSVVATAVAVPLSVPTRIATREVLAREFVLVEVTTDDGVVGVGYTYTGTTGAKLCAGFINDYFAPRLVGESALAPERVWSALFQEHLLIGRRGFLLRALSA